MKKLHSKKLANNLQVQLLSTDAYRNQYQHLINPELNDIDTIDHLEDRYDIYFGILSTTAQTTLLKREDRAKKKWITSDILQKMER